MFRIWWYDINPLPVRTVVEVVTPAEVDGEALEVEVDAELVLSTVAAAVEAATVVVTAAVTATPDAVLAPFVVEVVAIVAVFAVIVSCPVVGGGTLCVIWCAVDWLELVVYEGWLKVGLWITGVVGVPGIPAEPGVPKIKNKYENLSSVCTANCYDHVHTIICSCNINNYQYSEQICFRIPRKAGWNTISTNWLSVHKKHFFKFL